MKALIIEDEKMARSQLRRLIESNFNDIEISGEIESVQKAVDCLSSDVQPDIIFMDVELSDGNCFEIFRHVAISSYVIMTTAYDNYAIRAFEAGSMDYLLKPVDEAALRRAVGRCRERFSITEMAATGSVKKYKESSTIRYGDFIIPIRADEIAFFYSEAKSNYLMKHNGEHYLIESTLEVLDSELNPSEFFRISRGCIMSRKAVARVSKQLGGRLLIDSNPQAPFEATVSRARVEAFLKWLD